jgi:hypothetical protein
MGKSSSSGSIAAGSSSSTVGEVQIRDNESFSESHRSLVGNDTQQPPVDPSDRQPCGHDESYGADFHRSKSSESNCGGASAREARCEQAILRRMSSSCVREEAEDPVLERRSRED